MKWHNNKEQWLYIHPYILQRIKSEFLYDSPSITFIYCQGIGTDFACPARQFVVTILLLGVLHLLQYTMYFVWRYYNRPVYLKFFPIGSILY